MERKITKQKRKTYKTIIESGGVYDLEQLVLKESFKQ